LLTPSALEISTLAAVLAAAGSLPAPSVSASFAVVGVPMMGMGVFLAPIYATTSAVMAPMVGVGILATPSVQAGAVILTVPLVGTGALPVPAVVIILVFGAKPSRPLRATWESGSIATDVDDQHVAELETSEINPYVEPLRRRVDLVGAGTIRGELA
jgi:hypothetical protein